jgi:hypothetical protein
VLLVFAKVNFFWQFGGILGKRPNLRDVVS